MAATVSIYVEDIATQLLTYESIKLYSSAAATGTFTNLVATETLVAATEEYSITDSSGTASTYYRYTFYNSSGPVEGVQSEVFQALGATLLTIMSEAARTAEAGFAGTCSATGTTSTLVDAALRDQGIDVKFLEGAWLYRPDAAAAADKVRRTAQDPFTVASGTLAPIRDWTNAPASAEVYQAYMFYPPVDQVGTGYSWQRAVSDALQATWYVDQLNLGEGTSTFDTRFDLSQHIGYLTRDKVRRVFMRTTNDDGVILDWDASTEQGYWLLHENGPGSLTLEIQPAPATNETIIVEVSRQYAPLYNDTDITECPIDLAVKGALWKVFEHLNSVQPGKYALEEQRWYRERSQIYFPPHALVVGA